MKERLSELGRRHKSLLSALTVVAAGSLIPLSAGAGAAPAEAATGGTVLQTNLVSDLPGVAAVSDPNLVNPWGITESGGSPFWVSDNNAGVSTLYSVPGANNTPATIVPLVVSIPTPVSAAGGAPTGTVFNIALASSAFQIAGQGKSAPAIFLFATEDGTILGWNPGISPTAAVIAVDNSGNNFTNPDPSQQTGAVYKGLAIATGIGGTPIVSGDANSTALLYASNFRAGTVEVYDTNFAQVTTLPAGAFQDPALPAGYAPFNVRVLAGKVFVTYALQNATKHDDVAGPHHGFVDVFNLDGTPGLPNGAVRLISGGSLDSPWGLALAPADFAGLSAPSGSPVLLVGNFGNGRVHGFDSATGAPLGGLKDPDGEPIRIDGLWALQVGNGSRGGAADTVYFTAGLFGESHGLFGSLATVAAGSPEGPAEAQWVQANKDVVQLDLQQLMADQAAGAPASVIKQDTKALDAASSQLSDVEQEFASETAAEVGP